MNLEMFRGTTESFEFTVKNRDTGDPYNLQDGEVLVFGIKFRPYQKDADLVKTVTEGSDGVYIVTLHPEDTIDLRYGDYKYNVNIQAGNEFHPVVSGKFKIKSNATKHGDGG